MENEDSNGNEEKVIETTDKEEMTKSNKLFFKFAVIFILVIAAVLLFKASGAYTGNVVAATSTTNTAYSGDAQIVKMKVVNGQYILEPNTVKEGIPVRIEANMTEMPGCSRSVVISAFNVRKNLGEKDNVIEFTPDKAGTFNIVCSMNMYKGQLIVLESNGSKSAYQEAAPTGGHTCGGSGGGGCGGCGG